MIVNILILIDFRKVANNFMVSFLLRKVEYFSVYPKQRVSSTYLDWLKEEINLCFFLQRKERAPNRYETCIKQIHRIKRYPLLVMLQIKHEKQFNKTAFKAFIQKALLVETEVIIDSLNHPNETVKEEFRNEIINTPIPIGFSDELTNLELFKKIYENLNLTGNEGVYLMHQEMKKYNELLIEKEYFDSLNLENLSENLKEFFVSCLQGYCGEEADVIGSLSIIKSCYIILIFDS